MPDDATPAEVIEVIGLTGMHGEASQWLEQGAYLTRNTFGPIREGDILMLLETEREAKKLSRR